ncbi:MAG: PIN domain-containing protein [Burkholderiaceae bacterium]|nr:PIN domain-containing protein [Burkholderiaceae bacterium]
MAILDWDEEAADHYADIRADLRRRGEMIGANDLSIAAHARALDAVLVTNNVREFRRVRNLKLENWVR